LHLGEGLPGDLGEITEGQRPESRDDETPKYCSPWGARIHLA